MEDEKKNQTGNNKEGNSQEVKLNVFDLYERFGVERIDLKKVYYFDNATALKLSEELCQKHRVVPLGVSDAGVLQIAMADPFDMVAQQIIKSKVGHPLQVFWSPPEDIYYMLGRIFSESASFERSLQEIVEKELLEDTDATLVEEVVDILHSEEADSPAVGFVNSLFMQAVQERASDIHIEPQEENIRIRLRVDGVLRELPFAPKSLQERVTARVKVLSGLDIAERRVPQDGRIKFKMMRHVVDVRVSTLPGICGEKIALRILDKGSMSLHIDDLGVDPVHLKKYKQAVKQAHGMVLVTGPTGSGKTTTLYSTLKYVNSPTLNLITVEDPVEYRLPGINQVQIKPTVGLTFASCLRSILRQDPDVVMVGEMRDYETAEIAIRAALTGHLVLSTLHTNDAIATITRLLNIGIDKYLIISSVSVIIAQRLVRRVCLNCKEPLKLSAELSDALAERGVKIKKGMTFYQGKKCVQCAGTGFYGRMAVYEIVFINDDIRGMILQDKPDTEIRKAAEEGGMTSMLQDGINKARVGLTTAEEVMRVI